MINIKSFGLQYFSDQSINFLSLIMVVVAFIGRLFSGVVVDKFGVILTYRIILTLSAISQILFWLFLDNLVIFYITNAIF